MTNTPQTPTADHPGYWADAQGRLVPEQAITPLDRARDALVRRVVTQAQAVRDTLAQFKTEAFDDIQRFAELSAEQWGASLGGRKGNLTLYSYDGRYRIQRAMADRIVFDEQLQAARALIDECLAEWVENARPELQAIVTQAFEADREGNISTGRVLALRRLDIADERWKRAMAAIGAAISVVGSKSYLRVYERVGQTDRYVPISLDVAGV
ncbi:DUF3164 family protein [Chitiniphilus eburneus]|uniref:DUF3164 family protein n=1 Tax=Chitiniphilus eburneus TaxID=2571148 RepID=UPI0035D09859